MPVVMEILAWPRTVIDASLTDDHGVAGFDADEDGADDSVAGSRSGAHALLMFQWSAGGWKLHVLDDGASPLRS